MIPATFQSDSWQSGQYWPIVVMTGPDGQEVRIVPLGKTAHLQSCLSWQDMAVMAGRDAEKRVDCNIQEPIMMRSSCHFRVTVGAILPGTSQSEIRYQVSRLWCLVPMPHSEDLQTKFNLNPCRTIQSLFHTRHLAEVGDSYLRFER